MRCDFAHDAGPYVLGALSPADRLAFERHQAICPDCAAAVRELAGLPGLLSRVSPDLLETPPLPVPVPDTLLPGLVHEVRRAQRRRTWQTAGLATAAALILVVGTVSATRILDDRTPPAAAPSTTTAAGESGRAMLPLGAEPMSANLVLTGVAWGTRIDLTCTYASGENAAGWAAAGDTTYALVVRTRAGHDEQVATWRGLPGRTMHLDASTATERGDIASVEVRAADGTPVLHLGT
jgi:anti-sigma factor RsiW